MNLFIQFNNKMDKTIAYRNNDFSCLALVKVVPSMEEGKMNLPAKLTGYFLCAFLRHWDYLELICPVVSPAEMSPNSLAQLELF